MEKEMEGPPPLEFVPMGSPPLPLVPDDWQKCLVINFPEETKYYEILTHFRSAEPRRVTMRRRRPHNHPTTAVLYVGTDQDLQRALSLDGTYLNGHKIRVVDVPEDGSDDFTSLMQVSVLMGDTEPVRKVTFSNNYQTEVSGRRLNVSLPQHDEGKQKRERRIQLVGPYVEMRERRNNKKSKKLAPEIRNQKMDIGKMMSDRVLEATTKCCPQAQPWCPVDLNKNRITVCITVVVDETHVWGHVIDDNTLRDLLWLTSATSEIQEPDARIPYPEGSKTCCAQYQSEWCRCYVMKPHGDDQVEVFAIDYGNIMTVKKTELNELQPKWWSRPAQVWPIKVISSALGDLESLVNQKLVCERRNLSTEDKVLYIDILGRDGVFQQKQAQK